MSMVFITTISLLAPKKPFSFLCCEDRKDLDNKEQKKKTKNKTLNTPKSKWEPCFYGLGEPAYAWLTQSVKDPYNITHITVF